VFNENTTVHITQLFNRLKVLANQEQNNAKMNKAQKSPAIVSLEAFCLLTDRKRHPEDRDAYT